MITLNYKAYAKVNIGLEILYKRQDRYHEVNTIYSRISLADDINICKNNQLLVNCVSGDEIPQEENLVFKAAKLLKRFYKVKEGAEINLIKKIPTGAGLGGGSSDAATTLLGLSELWNIPFDKNNFMKMASELGADVPYFLKKGTAVALGKGEILDYFNLELPYIILLVMPDIKVSSQWAYKSLNIGYSRKSPTDLKGILSESVKDARILKKYIRNDFESTIFAIYPEIKKIKEKLYKSGALLALLSGSGSTVYGLFISKQAAKKGVDAISGYRTEVCEFITG
jgi:4-diphosphocytidyl-2-C-methyl-D-erythritol kinase